MFFERRNVLISGIVYMEVIWKINQYYLEVISGAVC